MVPLIPVKYYLGVVCKFASESEKCFDHLSPRLEVTGFVTNQLWLIVLS
jgi:hypothetical protein